VFSWGNPSRGDDALGPQVHDLLLQENLDDVELLTDFQLQIEHTLDLENRQHILFVDASISADAPFTFHQIHAVQDNSYSTHALSPGCLLELYEQTSKQPLAPAWLLSIRGYQFDLGTPLSAHATENLQQAVTFIKHLLTNKTAWR
jgi:hydrogenase maturation protease